ncbi:hypothetical protein BGZ65_010032, partial [Modicella reniformis]
MVRAAAQRKQDGKSTQNMNHEMLGKAVENQVPKALRRIPCKLQPHNRTAAQAVSDFVFLDNADTHIAADVMERIKDEEGEGEDVEGDGGGAAGDAKVPMSKMNHPGSACAEFRASGKSGNEVRQLATQTKQAIKTEESEIKTFRRDVSNKHNVQSQAS